MNVGGFWHFKVMNSKNERVVGNHTTSALARNSIRRLRQPGDRAFLSFDYPGRPNVEFDVDRPTLRTALALRGFGAPHFTGPNIAAMLEVDIARLHEALRPLEDAGWIEMTDRGTDLETWHMVAPVLSLDDLTSRAKRGGFDLDQVL